MKVFVILVYLLYANFSIGFTRKLTASYVEYLPWIAKQDPHEQFSGAIYNDLMNIISEKLQLTVIFKLEDKFADIWSTVSSSINTCHFLMSFCLAERWAFRCHLWTYESNI